MLNIRMPGAMVIAVAASIRPCSRCFASAASYSGEGLPPGDIIPMASFWIDSKDLASRFM